MDWEEGKIISAPLEEQMKTSYIDYAMSVIVARALPDVRDGLKPVHRRILYAMQEAGMLPGKPYKKSARIVGDVLGKYHPHGDTAVYESAVRMAQDFSTRYLLVDGHGNFGSIDGDSPAAMRYTEMRMTKLEMLRDLDKDTVDFMPNYDGSLQEPVVLPSRIPNLLVNGSYGIAVGMATNIPSHNLGEVVDGLCMMIDNPDVTIDQLMTKIKGPDFPTGGLIQGRDGIVKAYTKGRGGIVVRAKTHIEEMSHGKHRIVVTEIPYQVNKARVIESIADLSRQKILDGITGLRDESDRTGMRISIELRADVNPQIMLNNLFKHTQLQTTFGAIMLALVDGHPRELNLKEILYYYLKHQEEVVTRRSQFELNKAKAKAHILEGLLIALDNIDAVIRTIRESKTDAIAKVALMDNFKLSEKQAVAILDMRLRRLTGLEREKIEEEYKEIQERIAYLEDLLSSHDKIMGVVKEELLEEKKKFGDARRSQIVRAADDFDVTDLVPDEPMVIIMTRQNYIKRMSVDTWHAQARGGKGVIGIKTKEGDYVWKVLNTSTHHKVLFFTNTGRVYMRSAMDIPESSNRNSKGSALINFIPSLTPGEKVTELYDIDDSEVDTAKYLFMVTKFGYVKKTSVDEYRNIRQNGLIAIKLRENDSLVTVLHVSGGEKIFLATKKGMGICFPEDEVRAMGRATGGVRGIDLGRDDEVIGAVIAEPDRDIITISSDGQAKRNPVSSYRAQSRNGKGTRNFKRGYEVVAVITAVDDDDLVGVSEKGVTIKVRVADISTKKSRGSQGVSIQNLEEGDRVASIDVIPKDDEE